MPGGNRDSPEPRAALRPRGAISWTASRRARAGEISGLASRSDRRWIADAPSPQALCSRTPNPPASAPRPRLLLASPVQWRPGSASNICPLFPPRIDLHLLIVAKNDTLFTSISKSQRDRGLQKNINCCDVATPSVACRPGADFATGAVGVIPSPLPPGSYTLKVNTVRIRHIMRCGLVRK